MYEKVIQRMQQRCARQSQDIYNHINSIYREQSLNHQISAIENQKQLLAHLYQRSSAYTQLIIVAGYASFFTVWQLTKSYLSKPVVMFTGICILLSVSVFVLYEVWKMISNALLLRSLSILLEKNEVPEVDRLSILKRTYTEFSLRDSRVWLCSLIPTLLFGLLPLPILLYQFVTHF